jgi:AAA15 family ATPase/GTPase
MAINRVEIKDFLVFRGEFTADFCPGVNVIIGGNATGKTTLLKVMYGVAQHTALYLFFTEFGNFGDSGECKVIADNKQTIVKGTAMGGGDIYLNSVFIPEKDILSHSKGFLALNNKREISFDKTYIDIVTNAELPEMREVIPLVQKLADKISKIIDGEVIYEQDTFFIKKISSGKMIPFSFEASGYRKFGLLWKLLRNGLLEKGSVLFWDEPEASINPELMSVLVDILLELQRNGVQIFIATHSEILATYFAINREKGDKVAFYSLYKDEKTQHIKYDNSDRFDLLTPNSLMSEPVRMYEKELERKFGNG